MENLKDINLLDWHQVRFLKYIPKHFTVVTLEDNGDRIKLLKWLDENTFGRIGIEHEYDEHKKVSNNFIVVDDDLKIGFENPEEATMYAMFFI